MEWKQLGNNKKSTSLKTSFILGLGTFIVSIVVFIASELFLRSVAFLLGLILLILIILIGIIFDIIGIAAASSQEACFNAKAAKKIPGAKEAVWLAKNSPKVASFCNDVVGDVCGTISGAIGTALIFKLMVVNPNFNQLMLSSITVGIVAALTVSGKAYGKTFAIKNSNDILFAVGKVLNKFSILGLNSQRR